MQAQMAVLTTAITMLEGAAAAPAAGAALLQQGGPGDQSHKAAAEMGFDKALDVQSALDLAVLNITK